MSRDDYPAGSNPHPVFGKASERQAHHRGAPLTEEELAHRNAMIADIKAGINYSEIDSRDLLAAFIALLDKHRSAIEKLNTAVARDKSSNYRLKVSNEQARRILAEVMDGKF